MEITTPTGPPPKSEQYRYTSDDERAHRLGTLRRYMEADGLSALVVTGRDDIRYRGRTFYVSDVWQLLADTHVVIFPDGDPIFVGGQIFGLGQAQQQSDWVGEFRVSGLPGLEIADVLKNGDVTDGKVGVVGLSDASLAAAHLDQMKRELPSVNFVDATTLFEQTRHTNSTEALNNFRATSQVFRNIYADLEPRIKPGMREIDLAGEAHRLSREHGLRDPMVLLQTTPFGPLSFGTSKVIDRSDVVTVWIESAGPSGYWLEYRRCYTFGPPSAEVRDFWELQKAALDAGREACRAGNNASDFVGAVQDVLEESGFSLGYQDPTDPHSMFSLHGIGTDAIQGVWVPGNDRELKESEVVNIHPTVKFSSDEQAEKLAWVGVTENLLVTQGRAELLTHDEGLPHGLIEL